MEKLEQLVPEVSVELMDPKDLLEPRERGEREEGRESKETKALVE